MTSKELNGKKAVVIGLGVSNTPLIGWLLDRGAIVSARDKKPFELLSDSVKEYKKRGVEFICGEDYLTDLTCDYIFKAPGLRYDLPEITEAVNNGAVLTSEMETFFELCPCKIIGVTGSDGKTTTTTLIYKCLEKQYGSDRVFVGGNIGKPLLPELNKMDKDCFAVVELSSFQLHTMKHSPDISIITNLSPNHLDYHKGMEEYVEAKKNIYLYAKPGSVLVLNGENAVTKELGCDAPDGVEVRFFNNGYAKIENGEITCQGRRVLDTDDILIPGRHNVENYCGVICALDGIVDDGTIRDIAVSFGGVEHRIELVRRLNGVNYYNSSIDSSPTRTAAALNSFKDKVIVICGGYDKKIPFEPLSDVLIKKAKTVVLTGATALKIKNALVNNPDYKGEPRIIEEPDFKEAVLKAHKEAKNGDNVILSPACASFDAFPNFEVRGNTFKEIIKSL